MKKIILGALAAVTVTFTSAAADISVDENGQTLTVDCEKDKNVAISGNDAKVTLTGTCDAISVDGNNALVTGSVKAISVNGNENTVKLDGVDALSVNGNKNKVTWKRALTKKKPLIGNAGNRNKISRTK